MWYKRVTAQTSIFSIFLFLLTFVSPSKKKTKLETFQTHRCHVNGCCGFVHDEDAGLPHEGPC